MRNIKLSPSILSGDFTNLERDIRRLEEAGAELLHIDVMDGHFVPNITIGQPVVKAIKKKTKLPLDVHLMISNPDKYLQEFIDAGADYLSVHQETCKHLQRTLSFISKNKVKAGVALNPATPLDTIEYVLADTDFVLIMTVNPGFGGQVFIQSVLPKISQLDEIIKKHKYNTQIEVDGGINKDNIGEVVKRGASIIVAGAAVFQGDPKETIKILKRSFEA